MGKDREVMMTEEEEQRGGVEEIAFLHVKDRYDPLVVNPNKNFENLAIDDLKDMSDQGITDQNKNKKCSSKQ